MIKPVRFSIDDAIAAGNGGFNCGPAALCAVADLMPNEAIEKIPGFEKKGYTSPSMMAAALAAIKIPFKRVYECAGFMVTTAPIYPKFGLVRVQWAGPWTNCGVPLVARYRHTHWIAVSDEMRFDVNAMCVGGWIDRSEWESRLIPWLLKECEPKATGEWWPTHCWEI